MRQLLGSPRRQASRQISHLSARARQLIRDGHGAQNVAKADLAIAIGPNSEVAYHVSVAVSAAQTSSRCASVRVAKSGMEIARE